MLKPLPLPLLAFALLSLVPTFALAHGGHAASGGFVLGVLHPVGGLDHLLAMTAVGLFAWHLGGRALWLVPFAFVGTMALGGALGMSGIGLPLVELGIALSIVVIGGFVALGLKLPTALALAVVAIFAVFHGHAHGTEMTPAVSGLAYGAGFLLATALLHGAGLMAGLGLERLAAGRGVVLVRASGAAMAAAGIVIVTTSL